MPKKSKEVEVWQACDNLFNQTIELSYENIGNELIRLGYKRGSNSDLQKYRDSWQMQHESLKGTLSTIPKRSDKLSAVIDEIRAETWREARQELEDFKVENQNQLNLLQETIRYSQQEISDLQKSNAMLNQELSSALENIQTLNNENLHLDELLKNSLLSHQVEKKDFESYKISSKSTIEQLTKQCEQLASLHEKTIDAHKHELGVILENSEQQRHEHIMKIDQGKTQVSLLEKSIMEVTHSRDVFKSEVDRLKEEINMSRKQQELFENKIDNIDQTIHDRFKKLIVLHESTSKHVESAFANVQSKISDSFSKISDENDEIKNINNQLEKLFNCFENNKMSKKQNNHDSE